MAVNWAANTIMVWAGQKVSDHNRAPVTVSYERIGEQTRMAGGTMRQYFVADKRTWSTSWENLPNNNTSVNGLKTADLGLSASELETFYRANRSSFQMTIRGGDGSTEVISVMFTEFTKDIVKRGSNADLWNVSVSLTEV